MKRQTETAKLKHALANAGLGSNIRVRHGTGTAYAWVHIKATIQHTPECACTHHGEYWQRETCLTCGDHYWAMSKAIKAKAAQVLGRTPRDITGDNRIRVDIEFEEVKP